MSDTSAPRHAPAGAPPSGGGGPEPHHPHKPSGDGTEARFFDHSSARRINTDVMMVESLRAQYPELELVVAPETTCNLVGFAAAGHATMTPVSDEVGPPLSWTLYVPPARRIGGSRGGLAERLVFGKFLYRWRGSEFILYVVDGRDGAQPYPILVNNYLLAPARRAAEQLVLAAGRWSDELTDEVWVFDGGYWQKSRELFESVRSSTWDAVILDPDMKKTIIDDHLSFFSSRDTFARLKVPWKRGVIYHGPPGNGKTISIKAMMHTLYGLKKPVPTLYVRTLVSYAGPEYSIKQIFEKARQYAPCYLVFEDLDTIVSDNVRSYFLNEVDGLKNNDGIFMVGSTNHLDRLDPGISKRPSRFDRKYYFPDPNKDERIAYCHFWQGKLADNKDVDFPDELCEAIADITDDFSFAYIQEAFVAALLALARDRTNSDDDVQLMEDISDDWVGVLGGGDDLDKNPLWKEIQKQVKILREGMEEKKKKGE